MMAKALKLREVPSEKKIVEVRAFPGQLKVFVWWYVFWNTIYNVGVDILFAIVLCQMLNSCTRENLVVLTQTRILIAVILSIAHIHFRMSQKAKRRWREKYEQSRTSAKF
jgi:hypothetical protein